MLSKVFQNARKLVAEVDIPTIQDSQAFFRTLMSNKPGREITM
jgi:hypothetical protein